jgi:hypothetical protein
MRGECGTSTSDPRYQLQGLQRTSRSVQRRRFGRFLGIAALAGFGLLARVGDFSPGGDKQSVCRTLSRRYRRLQLAG